MAAAAAAAEGDAAAMFKLGGHYEQGSAGVARDRHQAVSWYRKSADAGHVPAVHKMGECYETGVSGPVNMQEAVAWYRKAADLGHVVAMNKVGQCFQFGRGVPSDVSQALVWFRKAAGLGHASAMHSLGTFYAQGKGVAQDLPLAAAWYKKAADAGNSSGIYSLAECYEQGWGVAQDTAEANRLYAAYASTDGNASRVLPASASASMGVAAANWQASSEAGARNPTQAAQLAAAEQRAANLRAAEQKEAQRKAAEQASKAAHLNTLHEAARAGNVSVLNNPALKALVKEFNTEGRAAIHEAAASNRHAFVEVLLRVGGMALDFRSESNRTALHEAAQQNQLETVTFLIRRGALVDAVDGKGNTPLLLAVDGGHYAVALALASAGASLDMTRADGRTSWDLVRENAPDRLAALQEIHSRQNYAKKKDHELRLWLQAHTHIFSPLIDGSPATAAVRDNRLNLLTSLPPEGPMQQLHVALLCLASKTFKTKHAETALAKYEAQTGDKSPLLLLAHARLYAKRTDATAQMVRCGLLEQFVKCQGAAAWLTQDETTVISSAGPLAPVVAPAAAPGPTPTDELEAQWKQIAGGLNADQRKPMEELLRMVGLVDVKRIALQLYTDVLRDQDLKSRGISPVPRTLNFAFVGNPGTGKTVCAKLFSELLEKAGARAGHKLVSMTASEALRKGSKAFASELASLTGGTPGIGPPPEQLLRRNMNVEVDKSGKLFPGIINSVDSKKNTYEIKYADGTIEEDVPRAQVFSLGQKGKVGGVLFLDEAYDLDPQNSTEGRLILADIMQAAEEHRDTVSIILAGYKDDIERKLYSFNNGMPSRFQTVPFEDFNELQLAQIWRKFCADHRWVTAQETTRVVSRRLARGAGRKGFGNARSVRKLFFQATSTAANPPTITVEDVIGKPPTPENLPELASALRDLDAMTGLPKVKEAIYKLVSLAQSNYRKELAAEEVTHVPMNRLLVGNPGCGKTTLAAIYGRVLKALRLLSNGEVVPKTASDFVGDVVGASQAKTRQLLEVAEGKVLLIDEAYNLDDQMYGKQALDTIVEKVMGDPGEDIAVLMLGYKAQMQKMLRDQNPGLARRFQPHNMLEFEDFGDDDLAQIFINCCDRMNISASLEVTLHAVKKLAQQRNLPNFGNAGAVKNLVAGAKLSMDARNVTEMDRADIDAKGEVSPEQALRELAGYGAIEDEMRRLGSSIRVRQAEGRSLDGLVPNFVFTGAPGTGKTTVARAIAKLLYSYGVLASDQVTETSGANLTGAYVGKAKEIVREKMQAARGGVLFIDEAYQLGEGSYGREAVAALVEMLTLPEYINGKTVVVLAGYHEEIHRMMEGNPGLKSRFQKYIEFKNWDADRCTNFVMERVQKSVSLDTDDDGMLLTLLRTGFGELIARPGWANGRDAINLCELLVQHRDVRVARDGPSGANFLDAEAAISEMLASRPMPAVLVRSFPVERIVPVHPSQLEQHQQQQQPDAAPTRAHVGTGTATGHRQGVREIAENADADAGANEVDAGAERNPPGTWNGMNIEQELRPINDVVERWSKQQLDLLRDNNPNALRELTDGLTRNGVDQDEAKRIAKKYIAALNELRQIEYESRRLAAERNRRPIIQCQVCRRTANYWAPCYVAPMQIGWEPAEVIQRPVDY